MSKDISKPVEANSVHIYLL